MSEFKKVVERGGCPQFFVLIRMLEKERRNHKKAIDMISQHRYKAEPLRASDVDSDSQGFLALKLSGLRGSPN